MRHNFFRFKHWFLLSRGIFFSFAFMFTRYMFCYLLVFVWDWLCTISISSWYIDDKQSEHGQYYSVVIICWIFCRTMNVKISGRYTMSNKGQLPLLLLHLHILVHVLSVCMLKHNTQWILWIARCVNMRILNQMQCTWNTGKIQWGHGANISMCTFVVFYPAYVIFSLCVEAREITSIFHRWEVGVK